MSMFIYKKNPHKYKIKKKIKKNRPWEPEQILYTSQIFNK